MKRADTGGAVDKMRRMSLGLGGAALVAAAGSAATAAPAHGHAIQTGNAYQACAETLATFFKRLDQLNRGIALNQPDRPSPDHVWSLMMPAGVWRRDGKPTDSGAVFAALIAKLPAGLVTAHEVGNLTVEAGGPDRAKADFYLTIFSGTATGAGLPVRFDKPGAILLVEAELIVTPAGWRIERMDSTSLFRG